MGQKASLPGDKEKVPGPETLTHEKVPGPEALTYEKEMMALLEASQRGEEGFPRYAFDSGFDIPRYDGQGCLVWTFVLSDPQDSGCQELGLLVNGKACSFLARFSTLPRPQKGWIVKSRLKRFGQDMVLEADLVSDFDWQDHRRAHSKSI